MFNVQATLLLLDVVDDHEDVFWNYVLQEVDVNYFLILRVFFFQEQVGAGKTVIVVAIYLESVFTADNQPFLIKFNSLAESREASLTKL